MPVQRGEFHQRRPYARERGGPREQVRSAPERLRSARSCEVLHSSLAEPLQAYKSLEPLRPHCPKSWRRFHLKEGFRVADQDTVVVPANDTLRKTRKGLARSSGGTVTYSATHRLKVELDVQEIAQILGGDVPGGGIAWTPRRLEWIFKERTGRPGCWVHYDLGIKGFLGLFPKSFEFFADGRYVQLRRRLGTTVLDDIEGSMVRLARSRHDGVLEHVVGVATDAKVDVARTMSLPQLRTHRFKSVYVPHEPAGHARRELTLVPEPQADQFGGGPVRNDGSLSPSALSLQSPAAGDRAPAGENWEERSEAATEKWFG